MILGDTRRTPDQGPTIASASIQVSAVPLRQAAAEARRFLLRQAGSHFPVHPDSLRSENARSSPPPIRSDGSATASCCEASAST